MPEIGITACGLARRIFPRRADGAHDHHYLSVEPRCSPLGLAQLPFRG
jgi:hypothetical protein